jgi:hypothetical protein
MADKDWYAFRIIYNRVQPLVTDCEVRGLEYFAPTDIIRSLFFLHCQAGELGRFVINHRDEARPYTRMDSHHPAVIPDHEMEIFRFVVTSGRQGLLLLGDDRPEYHLGDRVMVTEGPFKGAEGHIKRIKKDRRLVVTIPGVVAVATAYIHPDFLKKIDTGE